LVKRQERRKKKRKEKEPEAGLGGTEREFKGEGKVLWGPEGRLPKKH